MKDIIMPELEFSEDVAVVAYWHIEEGDAIEEGDDLVAINTSNGTIHIPAPGTGILHEVYFDEGDEVEEGDVLGSIEEEESEEEKEAEEEELEEIEFEDEDDEDILDEEELDEEDEDDDEDDEEDDEPDVDAPILAERPVSPENAGLPALPPAENRLDSTLASSEASRYCGR